MLSSKILFKSGARGAGCHTEDSRFESWVRHGCQNCPSQAPTSGCAQKLVGGKRQVHSSVTLVDLAVRSFLWFSPKLAYLARIWAKIPQKEPHAEHSTYKPRSLVRQSALTPTPHHTTIIVNRFDFPQRGEKDLD